MKNQPLVSILTPVYNGEKYIAECIESVLAQSYGNWEYVIVNNRSTDRTNEIAESYAARDRRIRVHTNTDFLPVIQNWNHAMRQISPESKYCKVVHADDELFAGCVEQMVEVAESNPNVGVVGAYLLLGNSARSEIRCTGIPYPLTVVDGHQINRDAFLDNYTVFGPPTAILLKSELIRACEKFYNEDVLYSDIDACFRLLQDCDFGFVHQILTFVRTHEESQTKTVGERFNKANLEIIDMLMRVGPQVFTEDEFRSVLKARMRKYYRFLGKNLLLWRKKEFWDYHREGLRKIGYPMSYTRLLIGLFDEFLLMALNLQDTVQRIKRRNTAAA